MKRFLIPLLVLFFVPSAGAHSSEDSREGKHFTFLFSPVAIAPLVNVSSGGLEVGLFLGPNEILSIQKRPYQNLFGGSDYGSTFSGVSYGLHFKHFLGDSFYVTTGLDYYEYGEGSGRISSSTPRSYVNGNAVAVEFAIGNHWQWNGFSLGCDWFGLLFPVSRNITLAQNDSTSWFLNSTQVELVRFYLGFAF